MDIRECIKQTLTTQFLVTLCSEGDNSVDADRMASRALEMIDNDSIQVIFLMPAFNHRLKRRPLELEESLRLVD